MKSDKWIKERSLGEGKMIEPFIDRSVKRDENGRKLISYGLSCAGYDLRLADEAFYPNPALALAENECGCLDPKKMTQDHYVKYQIFTDKEGNRFIYLRPGVSLLSTIEWINMPRDATAFVLPKSTYARCGVDVLNPLIEPEWCGNVTLSVVNTTNHHVKVYLGEALCQIVFQDTDEVMVSYEDRGGKYQGTKGVAVSRM